MKLFLLAHGLLSHFICVFSSLRGPCCQAGAGTGVVKLSSNHDSFRGLGRLLSLGLFFKALPRHMCDYPQPPPLVTSRGGSWAQKNNPSSLSNKANSQDQKPRLGGTREKKTKSTANGARRAPGSRGPGRPPLAMSLEP